MPRNAQFTQGHEPHRDHDAIHLQHKRTTGTFSFLNPTRAVFHHGELAQTRPPSNTASSPSDEEAGKLPDEAHPSRDEQVADDIHFTWRSRDNRKGRHLLEIQPDTGSESKPGQYVTPPRTSTLRATGQGIIRMLTQYPCYDVSYLVATIFTLGSCVWVINAFFVWLPLVSPATEFHNEIFVGGGITAFIGATIFEIGSVLLMFEAVNENNTGCFGWALEKKWDEHRGRDMVHVSASKENCSHHHSNKSNFVGKSTDTNESANHNGKPWQWYPSWYDLKTHYLRELGFLASLAQFCGASIFWISGFTALPGVNNKFSQGALDGLYWAPQIVGGSGFIISGTLFMLETQKNWYTPAWHVLGWHIGFWNLIGALGFTLCGALGPAYNNTGAQYEASLATFWGSWAFLIGSTIQWYESLDKHPVEAQGGSS